MIVPVAALIGSPVAHSLSPAIHNAAFAGTGWTYVAFDVAPGAAGAALDAMRVLGIAGYSVTTPHKEAVAAAVDELAPAARALRSVNTVVNAGDRLVGHSTDGDGFVASLAAAGVTVAGARVAIAGAGAAARSVVDALGRAGAAEIAIVNRSEARAEEAADLATAARVGTSADVTAATVVVNATSVGMGSEELPLDPALLRAGQVVADLVYHPLQTALLRAASARGCRTVDGLGMLVHQAVLQQVLWTGRSPDPAVLRTAAEAALADRSSAPPRHIVLVGLMGTGKTTTGRLVASRLGRRLLDSDEMVEARTGRTVREIWRDEGEPAYRVLETAALQEALAANDPLVIAAAGGVVLRAENRAALAAADALVVWLRADPGVLAGRVTGGDHRPLLDADPAGTLRQMESDRETLYREVADVSIDTVGLAPSAVADRIIELVEQ